MMNSAECISYLIEDPLLGDSLKPAILNRLANEDVGDFEVCAAKTYDESNECVVYIDQCSADTAQKIRVALRKTFTVLDEDFDAHGYEMPKGYGITLQTNQQKRITQNHHNRFGNYDAYRWN